MIENIIRVVQPKIAVVCEIYDRICVRAERIILDAEHGVVRERIGHGQIERAGKAHVPIETHEMAAQSAVNGADVKEPPMKAEGSAVERVFAVVCIEGIAAAAERERRAAKPIRKASAHGAEAGGIRQVSHGIVITQHDVDRGISCACGQHEMCDARTVFHDGKLSAARRLKGIFRCGPPVRPNKGKRSRVQHGLPPKYKLGVPGAKSDTPHFNMPRSLRQADSREADS